MPYNTRRKSLSLPSLGIHIPSTKSPSLLSTAKGEQPPSKKIKRDHSPSVPLAPQSRYDPTPPLSPPPERRVDHENINDEIVSTVVDVLEKTGNRPHTVKELAAVLTAMLNIVENSANPTAIISSRLNNYLKRSFSLSSPCLLQKKLITTHPRRIYFYLTTSPHQPIPDHEYVNVPPGRAVVSPALSDEDEERRRAEMSPSPEVDLSSHDLDDDSLESAEDGASTLSSTNTNMLGRSRTATPSSLDPKSVPPYPAEGDEREFRQSALRSATRETEFRKQESDTALDDASSVKRQREPFEEDGSEEAHNEATAAILGYTTVPNVGTFSSPVVGPTSVAPVVKREGTSDISDPEKHQEKPHNIMIPHGSLGSWGGELERHLGSPESVELDELDILLDF